MKSAMRKITYREIRRSMGRFLAILCIVMLGSGFLTGLKITKSAMIRTLEEYDADSTFFDFRVVSTLGLTDGDRDYLASMRGVETAEAAVSTDALFLFPGDQEKVLKVHSVTRDVNKLRLRAGRMPEKATECVLDAWFFGEDMIGKYITLSPENSDDTRDMFTNGGYKVVGLVNSPLYINFSRGTTTMGNGTVSGFVFMPPESFDLDYSTEIYLRLSDTGSVYSDEYDDAIEAFEDNLTAAAEARAELRYETIVGEANEEYEDALKQYNDGLEEYNDGALEYEQEKADAEDQLKDAMDSIYVAERKLAQARTDLDDGWQQLSDAESDLADGWAKYNASEADTLASLESDKAQLDAGWAEYNAGLAQYEQAVAAYGEQALAAQKAQLDATKTQLDQAQAEYDGGLAQLNEAKQALLDGQTAIDDSRAKLEQGERDYTDAYRRICAGRADYESARVEADEKFADAETELSDAKEELSDAESELSDARAEIDDIKRPTVYVLDRYTNSGYASFESDADIVDGIAKVFPIFFFLVAALVCVTTMNRMVDEQRTQIGTLKSLGYSSPEIMKGYLLYTGLASGVGSVAGTVAGSVAFPKMIWQAYNIMYGFTDIVLVFDWGLAALVCVAFVGLSLLVTWLSCRSELRETPAELVRPRTPKAGKRILLERITFLWKRFSFLRKVSARNIFRYKKRMYMMMVGIAGCTALLITGFGLNDSITGLADVQYGEISLYDAEVSFTDPLEPEDRETFLSDCGDAVESCAFLSMYSVDAEVDGGLKSVYLVATDCADMEDFMDFHLDGETQAYPGFGEVLINDNLARMLGVEIGDPITLQNSDMDKLTLTVSGIYYNVIYNYAYVTQETLEASESFESDTNAAYLNLDEDGDIYESAARVGESELVMSTTVNEEFRNLVRNMLDSMKYIVALVTFCAGALAFIVLYNLTNININERIREIATIKVLGFRSWESASYVFRENMVLTLMGAAVGIPLGIWLHSYVMGNINIDMISFAVKIYWQSYLIAIALTVLFAVIVDVFMYFRLERINMAESLKSVE